MDIKKYLTRNLLTGWAERAILIISAILLTPVLLSYLGKEQYGVWVAIGQGASIMMLLDFGIADSVARFMSRNLAIDNHEENIRVFSTALVIFFAASILIIVIIIIIAPFIPAIFKIADIYRNKAVAVFLITSVNIALIFPLRVGRGLLKSKHRYDLISTYSVALSLLRVALVLIIFISGAGSLIALALIAFCVSLLLELILFVAGMKRHKGIVFSRSAVKKQNFMELFSLGGSSVVRAISVILYQRLQIIAVGVILGTLAVPLFSVPSILLISLGAFINRIGATFTPIASSMHAKGDNAQLKKLNSIGIRYGLMLSLPLSIFLILFSESILHAWLGRSKLEQQDLHTMTTVIRIIAIPFALNVPLKPSCIILTSTGKHWLVARFFCLSSVIGLLTTIVLMIFTNLGVLGAAIGISVTYLATGIFLWPMSICRHLQMSILNYFKDTYTRPLLGFAILIAFGLSLQMLISDENVYLILLKMAAFSLVAFLISVFFILLPHHRQYLAKAFKSTFANH